MPRVSRSNSLAIIMCTHNGAQFIREQLDSIAKQTHTNWDLYIYDDGSSDQTSNIISEYSKTVSNKVQFIPVQYGHFAKNFLSAACNTPGHYDFYAFSDQDDIWEENKLESAIRLLETLDAQKPNLYCSRTELVDSDANHIGLSPLFIRKPSFKNAIVQSIAGGNTMVFNKTARDIITGVGSDIEIISHDWWVYQLITAVGGNILYDNVPHILYRQHSKNLIGSNNGLCAKIQRFGMLLNGRFRKWNDSNVNALNRARHLLSEENLILLDRFIAMRNSNIIGRIVNFYKSGVYRQTFLGNIGLFVGVLLNKV